MSKKVKIAIIILTIILCSLGFYIDNIKGMIDSSQPDIIGEIYDSVNKTKTLHYEWADDNTVSTSVSVPVNYEVNVKDYELHITTNAQRVNINGVYVQF